MLFKNRKVSNLLEKWGPLREIAWDDETIKWIAEREQLDVYMTHISKTVSLGSNSRSLGLTQTDAGLSFSRASDAELFNNRSEWAIHGVMTYPKFIPANITFTMDDEQFGWFFYDRRDDMSFSGRKINLPFLQLSLSDRDEQKAQLLYKALRDAIISGEKFASVRFWKKKNEGLMTQKDKEHGYSCQSRYLILGMVTWIELHAFKLPKWSVPTDQRDFSLDALPKSRFDLDRQLGRPDFRD